MSTIAAVAIGRNEGDRLVRCLTSLKGQADRIVYVDSGSTDDSVQMARDMGLTVAELDTSIPFTAARARNAGFQALKPDLPDYVQFVDGDCTVEPGWLSKASAELDARPELGVVTGWRYEIHPNRSLYNAIADFEWHRPAGKITACGGDMMVRSADFDAIGGFNPIVIAAEDDEFCTRLRKAGWVLERIPADMTQHDANMMRFGQWWSRAVRTGHGFAQVGHLHPEYFAKERKRVLVYGLALPLILLASFALAWWLPLILIGAYEFNYIRTAQGLIREGLPKSEAWRHALLLTLSKFPNLIGMAKFHLRRLRGDEMRLIEYK